MPVNSYYQNSKVDDEIMEAADLEAIESGFALLEGDILKQDNNLSDVSNAGTARTNLGLAIGTDVQAYSAVLAATTASFTTADETKLDGIETGADVTDTTNVTAAGALMDSEVSANLKTLALPASTTISAFGASLIDDADADGVLSTLGVSTFAKTMLDDADAAAVRTTLGLVIGTNVQAYDADILKADTSDNLSVSYTTDIEALGSVTSITPNLQKEWLKSATITGNLTINEVTDGNEGGCVILLTIDASGPYTVTLGTSVSAIGTIPDLAASTDYQCTVIKHSNSLTTVEIVEIG